MINYLNNSNASVDMMKSNCEFMKSEKGSAAIKRDTAMQNLIISNLMFLINRDSLKCDKTCTQISLNPQIDKVLHSPNFV
jgi:hypothetical protein